VKKDGLQRLITGLSVERTYPWTRTLRSPLQFSSTAALPPTLFLADCIINIAEFEFSTGTVRQNKDAGASICGLGSEPR
jgi:hypothetical protein